MSCGESKQFTDMMDKCTEEALLEGVVGLGNIEGSINYGEYLTAANPEWAFTAPAAPLDGYEDCSEIHINGKPYLMIDNSGPELLNPHKLQEEIVELHKELDEAYNRIQSMTDSYPVGTANNHVNDAEDAAKMIVYGMKTFGEMADSIVHGSYSSEYVASEGYSFSNYGGPTPEIDLSSISMVSDPMPGCEVKLVSAEEADYERAMSMVGK